MVKKYHGDTLYRIEYVPALLIPILMGILDSGTFTLSLVSPILGWCLLAVSMNLMNDIIDKDRDFGLSKRAMLGLTFTSLVTGLLMTYQHSLIYAMLFVALISIYNIKVQKVPILDTLTLILGYAIIGYFAFATSPKILTLVILVLGGFANELMDDIADRESTYKYLKGTAVKITILFSGLWAAATVYAAVTVGSYWIFFSVFSVITFLVSIRYRNNLKVWSEMKKIGVEIGKFAAVYLLSLLPTIM